MTCQCRIHSNPFKPLKTKEGDMGAQMGSARLKGKETMERFIFGVLLVVALSLSGTGADPQCPDTWSLHNGHCYKVFQEYKTWNDAENFCRQEKEGGHLASIHSDEERMFVAKEVFPKVEFHLNAWIGLSAPGNPPVWRWTDGSSFRYKSWAPGEPNNSDSSHYCVSVTKLSRYLQWNDQNCAFKRNFICKYQP